LTPSARSANLIAGDGTKNGFPAPNKELAKTKNNHLTGKTPYKFESAFLQGRVCEPSFRWVFAAATSSTATSEVTGAMGREDGRTLIR
jgi:hypothetical protein